MNSLSFEDEVKGCFTRCKGSMVLQIPSFIEAFCDLSPNIVARIRNQTDNTVNGKRYYEPVMATLFEFGVEHDIFNERIVERYKDRVNIVPKTNKNFSIVDQIFVDPVPNMRSLLPLFKYNFSTENHRLYQTIPKAYNECEAFGLPTFACTQVKTSHKDDPKITSNSLKTIRKDDQQSSTSHIMNRTPECDAFTLLVNAYSNVTTATDVLEGNEWLDMMLELNDDQTLEFKTRFKSLFADQKRVKKRKVHHNATEHVIQIPTSSNDVHEMYASLNPTMKTLYESTNFQKKILGKLNALQKHQMSSEEIISYF